MNLVHGSEFRHEDVFIKGVSVAGIGTSLTLPDLKFCFDTAQGLPFAYNMKHYVITHSHMDHAGGIPYIISQKGLSHQAPGIFYMGAEMIKPMEKVMSGWHDMEGFEYDYEFIPVEEGPKYPINNSFFFKAFPTQHRVPSRGYCVYQLRKKLRKEFKGRTQQELARLSEMGVEIDRVIESPMVSYTGDTKIEFLDLSEDVKKSKVLIVDCTYLDDRRSPDSAREWGHTHLDEIILRIKDLKCERLLLTHVSSRYRRKEAYQIVADRIGKECPEFLEKTVLFP